MELDAGTVVSAIITSALIVLTISTVVPVRTEDSGWYYWNDARGCTRVYRLGTGPDSNPAVANLTGMYYNVFGWPIVGYYPTSFRMQECDTPAPVLTTILPILISVGVLLLVVSVFLGWHKPPEPPQGKME